MEGSNRSNLGGGLLRDEDVGREKFGGLDGGDDGSCRGEELHPIIVVASDVAAGGELGTGVSGRNGPSKALAGDSDLLPGIVSRPDRVTGGEECITARIS